MKKAHQIFCSMCLKDMFVIVKILEEYMCGRFLVCSIEMLAVCGVVEKGLAPLLSYFCCSVYYVGRQTSYKCYSLSLLKLCFAKEKQNVLPKK